MSKKNITISVVIKRTFNLSNYENIAPMITIKEEIEDCKMSDDEVGLREKELREIVMKNLIEFKNTYIPKK